MIMENKHESDIVTAFKTQHEKALKPDLSVTEEKLFAAMDAMIMKVFAPGKEKK